MNMQQTWSVRDARLEIQGSRWDTYDIAVALHVATQEVVATPDGANAFATLRCCTARAEAELVALPTVLHLTLWR